MSHGDRVTRLPPGFRAVAASARARRSPPSPTTRAASTALQFHPEVVHTPHGAQLLRNFTHDVCGLSGDWTMAGFRADARSRASAPQVGGAG